jgi:hypothetical protein
MAQEDLITSVVTVSVFCEGDKYEHVWYVLNKFVLLGLLTWVSFSPSDTTEAFTVRKE